MTLNRPNQFTRRQLRRALLAPGLVGVPRDRQPQPGVLQVGGNTLGKLLLVRHGVERVEASTVEDKAEGYPVNFALEKISKDEGTRDLFLGSLLPCLFQGDIGNIGSDDLKAVLCKPDGVVAGATADIQSPAG